MTLRETLALVLCLSPAAIASAASDEPDLTVMTRMRVESFQNSKVMDTLSHLTDVIGPRLTGSPAAKLANQWTRDRLESWGLVGARVEPWGDFGRGWSFDHVSVTMARPVRAPLLAFPKAWTPGTDGPVRGKVVKATLATDADLEPLRGKLAGAVVLRGEPRDVPPADRPLFSRRERKDLEDIAAFAIPSPRPTTGPGSTDEYRRTQEFERRLREFLRAEGALAVVEASVGEGGAIRVQGGGSRRPGEDPGPPALVMAVEHFNRIARLLALKQDVELEIDVRARFHDDDTRAYNTIAEIAGTDERGEIVMLGAHLDSWHAGTGALDNAAGCAVVMEAARILKAIGVKPRRTVRVALWTGEEQNLRGSGAYVSEHFAARAGETKEDLEMPFSRRSLGGSLLLKPQHEKLSVYFNIDNGMGRIRGVYLQQNAAAGPIFESWLAPFHDLGAATVSMRDSGGSDHLVFDAVGLPGFAFIQDVPLSSRTYHSNWDVYDHVVRDDLVQSSVILAAFVYNAAMRDARIPRKALPNSATHAPRK
jgi:hypothetical protein